MLRTLQSDGSFSAEHRVPKEIWKELTPDTRKLWLSFLIEQWKMLLQAFSRLNFPPDVSPSPGGTIPDAVLRRCAPR